MPFSSHPAGEFPPLVFLPPREGRSLFPESLPFEKKKKNILEEPVANLMGHSGVPDRSEVN